MTLKLDKVNRGPHLSTLVASSISREIAKGRLKPGDQLPTEQQLAQTFGVSRNVIREAIARLRSEGSIWSQQGRGAFIADQPSASVLRIDTEALQQAKTFKALFELRGVLEVQAAAFAAERRSEGDLALMNDALQTMQNAPYGSVSWLEADVEFHKAITTATGNPYMEQFLTFVSEKVLETILASGHQQRSEDLATVTVTEHRRIFDAITAGNSIEARNAMRAHLQGAALRVGLDIDQSEQSIEGLK